MPYQQAKYDEPLISEMLSLNSYKLPDYLSESETLIPDSLKRKSLKLPEVAEYDVVRHFTRLSQMNYSVDQGIYPLGSCTMKFNPKFADKLSSFPAFTNGHPLEDETTIQGYLKIMYELQEYLKEIKKDALLISYYDPISLGSVIPPGQYGTDIAVSEGQQLGIHPNFGGPLLGLFSFKKEYVRRSPGRIIGETLDTNGKRAFVMTLQTREQHIRRAKATSNICTNQALMALTALTYLSIVGKSGLKKVADSTVSASLSLKNQLIKHGLVNPNTVTGVPFSDVLVSFNKAQNNLQQELAKNGILGGLKMSKIINEKYDSINNAHFFSVTERTTKRHIEKLIDTLEVL